ncbi:26S proteasome subunit RPN7-domain-containing protein [Zopfochytrium polystomum]|nr:26S proteasome subunit RPN7-domain-containing protein [Zopfochytrium polystomum]
MSGEGEKTPRIPNSALAQYRFILKTGPKERHAEAMAKLIDGITADEMAPFYKLVANELKFPLDEALYKKLQAANEESLKKIEDKIADAQANLGETEISDALISKAEYLARIGEKESAVAAFRVAFDKTGPLGARIDLTFALIRIGLFFADSDLINRNIEKARSLINEGGDWDRRNRLKVYDGINKLSNRDFKGAVDNLLETLATFTSTELMDYKDFVKYAILAAAITLKRKDFKKKVIDAPEILEVINELPLFGDYISSLYRCEYSKFFTSLAGIEQEIKWDRFLHVHYRYYAREMRIAVYTQLLESYRSLTIESMANSFGVTEDFLDSDVSKLIAAGRLNAVIDKVGGIIETNRPDVKNSQYQGTIKQGDLLLTRIQKLSRVV